MDHRCALRRSRPCFIQGWPRGHTLRPRPLPYGDAQDWYTELTDKPKPDDVDGLLAAITTRFSTGTTPFQRICQHFRLAQQSNNLEAYIAAYTRSLQKNGLSVTDHDDVKKLMDRVQVYQFIMSLNDDSIRRYLINEEPPDMKTAIDKALKKNNATRLTNTTMAAKPSRNSNPSSKAEARSPTRPPTSASSASKPARNGNQTKQPTNGKPDQQRRPSTRYDGSAPWCRTCLAAGRDHRHDYKICPHNNQTKTTISTVTTAPAEQEPDANEILKSLNDAIYAGQNQASKGHNVVNTITNPGDKKHNQAKPAASLIKIDLLVIPPDNSGPVQLSAIVDTGAAVSLIRADHPLVSCLA